MWPFGKTSKNRRFDHAQILELKTGSSRLSALRVRMASVALGASLSLIILLFLLWRGASWVADRLVYENPAFAIQTINIETDGIISTEQIRRWSDVRVGQNLLALDLNRVKRDLELVPMIRSVVVERVLPQTLRLKVTERQPVAQALQPLGPGVREQIVLTLDSTGYVMMPVTQAQRQYPNIPTNEYLPTIIGVSLFELRPGRKAESPQIKAALKLIEEFERSPMAGLVDLRWIDLSSPQVLEVTAGYGCKVIFPMERLDYHLARWHAAHMYLRQYGKALARLDLSVANNVPYEPIDLAAVPPVTPKATKTTRISAKKKNV